MELALVMPLIVLLTLALVQVGLLVRDRVVVTHAAREAARAAAVGSSDSEVTAAATASGVLDASRTEVVTVRSSGRVTVTVRYAAATEVPLVGPMLGTVPFVASVTMRLEA